MGGFSASAILAVLLGVLVLPVFFVPYVAWTYRRRGTLGSGHALIAAGAVVYAIALWTYTIVPLPDPATLQCTGGPRTQLVPFGSLGDVDLGAHGLRDPALVQLVANVVLFIPFGMLVRHLAAPRRVVRIVVAAAAASLFIELTQLTGIWGVYPCGYRVFDVDDVLTNTLGAAIGVAAAPLLRRVPGQDVLPTTTPRVVARERRLVGMAADVAAVHVVGFLLYLALAVMARETGTLGDPVPYDQLRAVVLLAVAVVLLLGVPLTSRGATLGQLLTFVRPVDLDGRPPRPVAVTVRWAAGSGGYFLLYALGSMTAQTWLEWMAHAWVVVSGGVVVLRHPRGLSGYASGLTVVDSREAAALTTRARDVDPRSLGSAAVAVVSVTYLGFTGVAALGSLSPTVGADAAVLGIGGIALATAALVPYLVANGVVTVRREGRRLATMLPLLTAAGVVGLLGTFTVAVLTGTTWLVVVTLAVMAGTGYLGLLFLAFLVYGQWYARRPATGSADAVVVLGSRVFGETVPPLLAARIERGVEVLHQQLRDDPDARTVLVCSGGQGPDETMPEGAAMAAYAVAHGAPEARVLAETRSRSTQENLLLSRELMLEHGLDGETVVVTNDFHAFRAAIIAREVGVAGQVIGAPTARYYFPAAVIREFVGVVARAPVVHGAIVAALALVVGGVAALVLR